VSDDARHGEFLDAMLGRFPAVAERVRRVYGLRLPRHVAVFAALWASARYDRGEREALNYLGLGPWGVADYFGDGGLELAGRDGLDERLHCRFRRDPAEFVTVMSGGSDGLHFGLWYDDPADFPAFIAHNYARDSAETWTQGFVTLLDEVRWRIGRVFVDYGQDGEEGVLVRPLLDALDWFAGPVHEALAADSVSHRASEQRPAGWISIVAVLPPGSGDPHLALANARLAAFRAASDEAAGWIADAERELAAGLPAYALAVGAELHWLDRDEYRQAGRDLLVGAYRALGRDALADIAEIHAAHRDLPRVDVLA
jgi:hypothetical protein